MKYKYMDPQVISSELITTTSETNQIQPEINSVTPVSVSSKKPKIFLLLVILFTVIFVIVGYFGFNSLKTNLSCGGFMGAICPRGYFCGIGWCMRNILERNPVSLKDLEPVPLTTPTPEPETKKNPYINTKYGFSIKYPEGWSFSEKDSNVIFGPLSSKYVTLNVYTSSLSTDLIAFKNISLDLKPVWSDFKIGEINGKEVRHLGCQSGNCREVIFQKSKLVFNFFDQNNLKELDQMLSTFQFLDQLNPEGKFCGGFAGAACPTGYNCQLDGNYPDAGGKCIKE